MKRKENKQSSPVYVDGCVWEGESKGTKEHEM